MKAILAKFNIDETLTKSSTKPQKVFNKVKYNVPNIEDYNYMADLLHLPTTEKGNKYCLVMVDLGNREFDIEPIKNKDATTILTASKAIFKRGILKKPKSSIQTDGGGEFQSVFHKYLYDNNILQKVGMPFRHTQMANVESLNKQLGRVFNGYMNSMEEKKGETFNEWDNIVSQVRTELNKFRKTKKRIDWMDYPTFDQTAKQTYHVGDVVLYKLDAPENALGHRQTTANFRQGDYKYSKVPKKITQVFLMNTEPYYRYGLEGMDNVSYSDYQLIPSKETETKYIVKQILGRRKSKGKFQYLVWYKGEKKKEASWQPKEQLVEDGLEDMFTKFDKKTT